jgi:gas vesicle protein
MTDSQKFIAGVILGAAAGAAITVFLNSDKGKEILADVKDMAQDTSESLRSKMDGLEKEVKGLLQKGKQFIESIEQRLDDSLA